MCDARTEKQDNNSQVLLAVDVVAWEFGSERPLRLNPTFYFALMRCSEKP